jgi:hypothetical protein
MILIKYDKKKKVGINLSNHLPFVDANICFKNVFSKYTTKFLVGLYGPYKCPSHTCDVK